MNDLFRCDYCGANHPLSKAQIKWVPVGGYPDDYDEDSYEGTIVYTTAVYCSNYCGRHALEMAVGS